MTTVIVKLNRDQFIAALGQHEYVRGFSPDAVELILDFAEEQQQIAISEGWVVDGNVTGYFQRAEERTASELEQQYSYANYDSVDDIAHAESYHLLGNGKYLKL